MPAPKLVVAVGDCGCNGEFSARATPVAAAWAMSLRWMSPCPVAADAKRCAGHTHRYQPRPPRWDLKAAQNNTCAWHPDAALAFIGCFFAIMSFAALARGVLR
jgi:hypothetical protein